MERMSVGMAVYGVDDRLLGSVAAIRSCCFEVGYSDSSGSCYLTPASVFNVAGRVTLMCMNSEVSRYACPLHQPKAAAGGQGR